MIQPQYNPQEALERVKLMMKYDMSKTLNENKEIIFEQVSNVTGDVGVVMQEIDRFGNSDEQKIVDILKKYNTKKLFNNFLIQYKEIKGEDFATHLMKALSPYNDNTEWGDLRNHLKSFGVDLGHVVSNGKRTATFTGLNTPEEKKDRDNTSVTKYTSCTKTYKPMCKSPVIAKVQKCLGITPALGNYGRKTYTKLTELGYPNGFTDADVEKICGGLNVNTPKVEPKTNTPQLEPKVDVPSPEVSGEVITIDGTNTDF